MAGLGVDDLTCAQVADDLRGMTVVDPNLHRVGEVDGVVVDQEERRPTLLVVASGGLLGLPRVRRLIPVGAVARVDDRVHVVVSHEQVHRFAEHYFE